MDVEDENEGCLVVRRFIGSFNRLFDVLLFMLLMSFVVSGLVLFICFQKHNQILCFVCLLLFLMSLLWFY